MSQDCKFAQIRCNNVTHCDVLLQLKLTKPHSESSPLQQLEFGKILELTMESNDARKISSKILLLHKNQRHGMTQIESPLKESNQHHNFISLQN